MSKETLPPTTDSDGKPLQQPKQCILGYIRVSTMMQVEGGLSLEAQEKRIRQYAKAMDFHVRQMFFDLGISGKDDKNRAALQKLREVIKPGEKLCVMKLDRLARNSLQALTIEKELRDKHASIISIDLNLDSSSAIGMLLFSVMSSFSVFERQQTSERIRQTMGVMSYTRRLRTKAPFGWRFVGKSLPFEPVPSEQATLDFIKSVKKEHPDISLSQLTYVLNQNIGIHRPRGGGKRWWAPVVRVICMREKITFPTYDMKIDPLIGSVEESKRKFHEISV